MVRGQTRANERGQARDGVVGHARNGTAFYTSTKVPAYPLLVDCALYNQNATLSSVVIAGAQ